MSQPKPKQPERRRRTHLTLAEVAERWGVSVNFVRREIWRGAINCTRFGRTIRVTVGESERYADSCIKRSRHH